LFYDKNVRKFLLTSISFFILLTSYFYFFSKSAYAACGNIPEIPVSIKSISAGSEQVTLEWSKFTQDYIDGPQNGHYNGITFYVNAINPNGNLAFGSIYQDSDFGRTNTNRVYNLNGFTQNGTYKLIILDFQNPTDTSCSNGTALSFNITNNNAGLAVGDTCYVSEQKSGDPSKVCPSPSVCGSSNGTFGNQGTCIAPPGANQPCDPTLQGPTMPATTCTGNTSFCLSSPGDPSKFTCQLQQGIGTAPPNPLDVKGPPLKCAAGSTSTTSCATVASAFGIDIPTDIPGFTKVFAGIILGFTGAIALILIIISGYRLMVSRGDPEGIQKAREQLTAAIVGLLFAIFSLVILQVIGVDILGIFSK
jgi:hypothetical protein